MQGDGNMRETNEENHDVLRLGKNLITVTINASCLALKLYDTKSE